MELDRNLVPDYLESTQHQNYDVFQHPQVCFRLPKYQRIETMRPLIEVHWWGACWGCSLLGIVNYGVGYIYST